MTSRTDEPPSHRSRGAPASLYLGLALVTGASLALEILLTRLLSVLTWYSLAFLVITLGLFGLTLGALRVHLQAENYRPDRCLRRVSKDALWFAALIPCACILLLVIPLRVAPVATTLPLFVVFTAVLALPFVPAGAATAAILTRTGLPIGRLYAVDLAGAAAGALCLPIFFRFGDALAAAFFLAALAALGGFFLASAAGERRLMRGAAALALALAIAGVVQGASERGLEPLWVKGKAEEREDVALEVWNSHSRVQVSREHAAPAVLWDPSKACDPLPTVRQRRVEIDGDAGTMILDAGGDVGQMGYLLCDITSFVHLLRPGGPVAVLGVGGSKDIQAALLAGHDQVVGIEINGAIHDILLGPWGAVTGIQGSAGVRLVHDEARSWLARHDETFQVIQASLTDTWAATGAGAHVLGENGLYTLDGWRLFLSRLQPGGIFTVSRWHTPLQPAETHRMAALAVAALLERGVASPSDRIALVASRRIATLLVGRDPFSREDLELFRQASARLGFRILALPGQRPEAEGLTRILEARDERELEAATLTPALDLRPPRDDRPYFFNVVRLSALWHGVPPEGGANDGNRLATGSLALTLVLSLALAGAVLVVPTLKARGLATLGRPGMSPALGYFLLIGVAFLLAEIALLQRLSLVLGHPAYSLMIVLPGIVAATGAGAWVSDRFAFDRRPGALAFPIIIAMVLSSVAVSLEPVSRAIEGLGLAGRGSVALGIVAISGFVLGFAFPAGMRLASRAGLAGESAWLWAMNGVGSLVGGAAALVVSHALGIRNLLLLSAALYGILTFFAWRLDGDRKRG